MQSFESDKIIGRRLVIGHQQPELPQFLQTLNKETFLLFFQDIGQRNISFFFKHRTKRNISVFWQLLNKQNFTSWKHYIKNISISFERIPSGGRLNIFYSLIPTRYLCPANKNSETIFLGGTSCMFCQQHLAADILSIFPALERELNWYFKMRSSK